MSQQGVTFVRPPDKDVYGNLWDLIEPFKE
jgi:hypothetical protein